MNKEALHAAMKAVLHCIATIYREFAPEASAQIAHTAQTLPDFGRSYIAVRREHIVDAAAAYGKGGHNPTDPWDVGQRSLAGKLHEMYGIYANYFHEIQAEEGGAQ